MKAEVSLSCCPTLFIARPAIHVQMTSQIQSPDFRSPGWKMSRGYIYTWIQDSLKLTGRKVCYISNTFPCSQPLAKHRIRSKSREGGSWPRVTEDSPVPGHGGYWAGLWQPFGNLSTGESLDSWFLSEGITAHGIFLLCLVSSPNKYF